MAEIPSLARAPAPVVPVLPEPMSLMVAPVACRLILRGDDRAAQLAGGAFGTALPMTPCRSTKAAGREALWLGPDEWLLLADATDPERETTALAAALQGVPHSLVDVTHRQIGFCVSGDGARRLLSAGCPLDLDDRAFPVGMAVRTVFAKAEIVLWRPSADAFRLEVWRSFADYLLGLLGEAARGLPRF